MFNNDNNSNGALYLLLIFITAIGFFLYWFFMLTQGVLW